VCPYGGEGEGEYRRKFHDVEKGLVYGSKNIREVGKSNGTIINASTFWVQFLKLSHRVKGAFKLCVEAQGGLIFSSTAFKIVARKKSPQKEGFWDKFHEQDYQYKLNPVQPRALKRKRVKKAKKKRYVSSNFIEEDEREEDSRPVTRSMRKGRQSQNQRPQMPLGYVDDDDDSETYSPKIIALPTTIYPKNVNVYTLNTSKRTRSQTELRWYSIPLKKRPHIPAKFQPMKRSMEYESSSDSSSSVSSYDFLSTRRSMPLKIRMKNHREASQLCFASRNSSNVREESFSEFTAEVFHRAQRFEKVNT